LNKKDYKNNKAFEESKFYNNNFFSQSIKLLYIYIFIKYILSIILEYKNKIKPKKILSEEYKDIQEYIDIILDGIQKPIKCFNKVESPKISIVIPLYNGEKYIKTSLLSIQNQDFQNIEIIIVDDNSEDNSIKVVKNLMERDKRISLYQNKENKGILFTKIKGVSYAKSKYVMVLDEDDMYVQKDAFSTLYMEAEKYNLDIVGFASILNTTFHINKSRKNKIHHYYTTPVIFQPLISKRSHDFNKKGEVKRIGDVIWIYFYKNELFQKVIKEIDEKYLNSKMICHEDYLLIFLLTRKAFNLRQMNRIFHIKIRWEYGIKPRSKAKESEVNDLFCSSYINYIEFILMKTNNNTKDKKIASFELKKWYMDNDCRNNTFIRKRAKKVCKLFLKNKFIEKRIKKEIKEFLYNKTIFGNEYISFKNN